MRICLLETVKGGQSPALDGWSLSCLWRNSGLQNDHTNDIILALNSAENSEAVQNQWHRWILESNRKQEGPSVLYS